MVFNRWQVAIAISLVVNIALFGVASKINKVTYKNNEIEYIPIRLAYFEANPEPTPIQPVSQPPLQKLKSAPVPVLQPHLTTPKPIEAESTTPHSTQESIPLTPAEHIVTQTSLSNNLTQTLSPVETVFHPIYNLSKLPYFKVKIKPVYPEVERLSGLEAQVIAEVYINERGVVGDIKIVKSGGTNFDYVVINSLRQCRFEPGYINNNPVATRIQIPFVFKLQ